MTREEVEKSREYYIGVAIGRREMLDKVCQYLFENYHGEKLSLRMIEDMRKAMEE